MEYYEKFVKNTIAVFYASVITSDLAAARVSTFTRNPPKRTNTKTCQQGLAKVLTYLGGKNLKLLTYLV